MGSLQVRIVALGIALALAQSLGQGALASEASDQAMPPLRAVPQLDVKRYLGKWYEIGSIPQRFQKNCVASTATYSAREDGDIDVLNACRKFKLDGELDEAHGKAWVPDASEPGKLLVRFFWPFRGDYWVLELGEHYEYAVVGHPSRDYLWVLSRTPQLPSGLLEQILGRLKSVGYDITRIRLTPQPGGLEGQAL